MKFASLYIISISSAAVQVCAQLASDGLRGVSEGIELSDEYKARAEKYATIRKRLAEESPMALRKMSPDEGEMFFLDYWSFTGDDGPALNSSAPADSFLPAVLPILNESISNHVQNRFQSRQLSRRDFQCPSGTNSCSNIGRSDACCAQGLTCNLITNSGSGDVGCCLGNSCNGQLTPCQSGYSFCEAFGGGCCIPGYACAAGGCILTATATVVVTPTQVSTTSTPTTSSTPPTTTTSSPTTSSATSSPSPSSTSEPSTTAIIPPSRPTSVESSSQVLTSMPATITATACPTGFYQCSAYYNTGACCQVGRDCGMTSCPPSNPSSALVSDGVTIVVGAGGAAAAATGNGKGSCATGWFSCAASLGGNCCPTGFNCGTASCWLNATAGAVQTGSTPKEIASGATIEVPEVLKVVAMILVTMVMAIH